MKRSARPISLGHRFSSYVFADLSNDGDIWSPTAGDLENVTGSSG
jgi:hypothetical protein